MNGIKLQNNPNHNQIKLRPLPHPQPVLFSKVSVDTPQGEKLLGPLTIELPKGVTLIQGPSGIGKTTIFRAIAGLWLFGQGEINLPKNNAGLEGQSDVYSSKTLFSLPKNIIRGNYLP